MIRAQDIMDEDHKRLIAVKPNDAPQIFFHEWTRPSFSYGYFTKIENHLEPSVSDSFDSAKRPTGGGIIFHTHDLSFSIILPSSHPFVTKNTLQNYLNINSFLLKAIGEEASLIDPQSCSCPGPFCMAAPTVYDLVIDGKKVGGAAQRRTKTALLHHGSLCLKNMDELEPYFKNKSLFQAALTNSRALTFSREALIEAITCAFLSHF